MTVKSCHRRRLRKVGNNTVKQPQGSSSSRLAGEYDFEQTLAQFSSEVWSEGLKNHTLWRQNHCHLPSTFFLSTWLGATDFTSGCLGAKKKGQKLYPMKQEQLKDKIRLFMGCLLHQSLAHMECSLHFSLYYCFTITHASPFTRHCRAGIFNYLRKHVTSSFLPPVQNPTHVVITPWSLSSEISQPMFNAWLLITPGAENVTL